MGALSVAATRYPGETRAVLLNSQDEICEVHLFRGTPETAEGAIWRGRVLGSVSGAKAVMVDIGGAQPAFLPVSAWPGDPSDLCDGQSVLVMIDRAARMEKGPRVTGKIKLSSPRLVFSPFRRGASVSRRLKGEAAQAALRWAEDGTMPDEGWVVRGAAAQCALSDLDRDRECLRQCWAEIRADVDVKVQCVRGATDPFAEWLAEVSSDVTQVFVSGGALISAAKDILGGNGLVKVSLGDAFAEHGGDDGLADALSPMVALPNGGSMSIEPTRAFWSVDVDTGGVQGSQAVQTCNDAAMEVLAKVLRLRNIGGAVVVDVIPESKGGQQHLAAKRLLKALRGWVKDDPRVQVYGVSPLGHIELVRARRGLSVHDVVYGDTIADSGHMAETEGLEVLRNVVSRVRIGDVSASRVAVSASVLGWFEGVGQSAVAEAEIMIGQSIKREMN